MADKQGRFVILDTTLAKTDATLIDELSGRQGDNGRVVYFALKDGQFPHDLTGQDVQLEVKDSAGKIKVIHGINERVSDEGGLFNLIIPAEVYQASGDVQEAYLAVVDNKGVKITSIPIAFTVFENGIIISANASQDYLSSVDKMIADAYKKIDDLTAYYDTLEDKIQALTDAVNKNQVALLNTDNTFSKSLTVKGGITADLHGTADKAKSASNSDNFAGHSVDEALGHDAFRKGTHFIAHRGANHVAPENSLPAFKRVSNHTGIEFDIHQTSDGQWVVMHDDSIDRMTAGSGNISSYTLNNLRKNIINEGSNVKRFRADELVIPTLQEVLAVVKEKRLLPVIEIKVDGSDKFTNKSYDSLAEIINQFGVANYMKFESFGFDQLVAMKQRLPMVEVSWSAPDLSLASINKAKSLGINAGIGVDFNHNTLTKNNVTLAHNAGLLVSTGTPDDDKSRDKLLALGVDFITTNSLSGELRFQRLDLMNGWKNAPTGYGTSYIQEVAPGKVELNFKIYGGNRSAGTTIAVLPDWASSLGGIWSTALVRINSNSANNLITGVFYIDEKEPNTTRVTVGPMWDKGSNVVTDWVSGSVVYNV